MCMHLSGFFYHKFAVILSSQRHIPQWNSNVQACDPAQNDDDEGHQACQSDISTTISTAIFIRKGRGKPQSV